MAVLGADVGIWDGPIVLLGAKLKLGLTLGRELPRVVVVGREVATKGVGAQLGCPLAADGAAVLGLADTVGPSDGTAVGITWVGAVEGSPVGLEELIEVGT